MAGFPSNGTWDLSIFDMRSGGRTSDEKGQYLLFNPGPINQNLSKRPVTVKLDHYAIWGSVWKISYQNDSGKTVANEYTTAFTLPASNELAKDIIIFRSLDRSPYTGEYRYIALSTMDNLMTPGEGPRQEVRVGGPPAGNSAIVFLPQGADFDLSNVFSSNNALENNVFDPCFLPGSLISTPSGLIPVENLKTGDEVFAYKKDGSAYVDRLSWVGRSTKMVHNGPYDEEAGYPIRVVKDAIAEGMPFKDLLITAEHCLFFDGKFIPARMLVNGSSIYYDKSFTSYEYLHIETEKHSVVMADGLLTESYLDTGNRNAFLQDGPLFSLGRQEQDAKTWDRDAAAPLTVDSAVVEPIYRQIEERARNMQCAIKATPISLTEEDGLCLKTGHGQIIQPIRKSADEIVFMIPEQVRAVRIISNASRPCDTIGPFVDDRRELGVLVGQITLFASNQTTLLTEHLQNESLKGWHSLEGAPMRWTDGDALLPLSDAFEGPAILAIKVIAAGPYLIQKEQASNTRSVA